MKYTVIPSRGIVVFPGHTIVLEVGRKSSLNAIDLAILQNGSKLVIVSQKDPMQPEVSNSKELFTVGTLVTVKVEKEFDGGVKRISTHGLKRVKIKTIDVSKNLIEADVSSIREVTTEEPGEKEIVELISRNLEATVGTMMPMPKNVLASLATGISASELADLVAHYVPFTYVQKQTLLETANLLKRLQIVNQLLVEQTNMREIDNHIDSTIKNTLDSQQREFLLREKLKAVKEELGELSSKDTEIDEWIIKLKDDKYPKEIKDALAKEIKRYEAMPSISAEAHVSKGYIDWLIKLPWNTFSEDSKDLVKAKKVLDKYHFGLIEIKERIIEHLAVKINTGSNSSPILTLVGPPGVGKTSLAKSIASALGREMIKVSLGGVKDEAEIRGHRRTYVGALPGKIIQAINKAQTSNPIILLDEIDKMASDNRGDPTSAMLEVLDPEQNKKFQDNYLELEYDLSNVMFFATANYINQIPTPLLDRVELIHLHQYTSEEKVEIAKKHLIPKVLKENGLAKSNFSINDKVIKFVIDKYTQEAGVRGLQRELSKIARKIVVLKLAGKVKGKFDITEPKAKTLLGKIKIDKEVLKGKAEQGVANGMYFSDTGGGVLSIEVKTYPSKDGKTLLTGSIQEVMQESLNIAVGYLRAHAKDFGIDFDFEKNTIQVHVPEGATPKDGPSAGIAFTTAVLSALINKKVARDIALTGEITLRGEVLAIGGLKEKTIGAVEAGVKKIFIPVANKKDIPELSNKVKKEAEIIPVSTYKEVYKNIFA